MSGWLVQIFNDNMTELYGNVHTISVFGLSVITLLAESFRSFLDKSTYLGKIKASLLAR